LVSHVFHVVVVVVIAADAVIIILFNYLVSLFGNDETCNEV